MSSTSVKANYGTMSGQDHRSSDDFPNWDAPEGGTITFEVTVQNVCDNQTRRQPTFALWHDINNGTDTTWYTGLSNGSIISPSSGNGGPGGHSLYVVTTNSCGEDPAATYEVKAIFSK